MYVTLLRQSNHFQLLIDRPDRMNGLGTSIGQDMLTAIRQISAELTNEEATQRLLVITAQPIDRPDQTKIWIAGGDLKEIATLGTSSEGDRYSQMYRQICELLECLPIPVLAAIDGHTIGGGIELCLAADLRLATEGSKFSFKQVQMGLATGYGGCRRLVEAVGLSLARHWLLTGQTIDSKAALSSSLVQELVTDSNKLQVRWEEIADYLAGLSFKAVAHQKSMLTHAWLKNRSHAMEIERKLFAELWMSPSHCQALGLFHQK